MRERPRALSLPIEDLLLLAQQGRLRVPNAQRPLSWEPEEIRLLLDSVYRGYPIGTLLFWERPASAAVQRIGPVRIDSPSHDDAMWVIDGQQRIASLVGTLLHPATPASPIEDAFRCFFDLALERVVIPDRHSIPQPHYLPFNLVTDTDRLLQWLLAYKGPPEHRQLATRIGKLFREYPISAYVVVTEEESVLREIFSRINTRTRSGKPQTFNALIAATVETGVGTFAELAERLSDFQFGAIEEPALLKVFFAVNGLDVRRGFREQLDRESMPEAWSRAELALRETIVFLKQEVGIPHVRLLPFRLPLYVLGRFFDLYPRPSARSRRLLARWVWRGAVTEAHQGESVGAVQTALGAISSDGARNGDHAVQSLLAQLPGCPAEPVSIDGFNFREARAKVLANALLSLRPRSFDDGNVLEPGPLLEERGPDAFVHAIASSPTTHTGLHAGLANRLAHPLPIARDRLIGADPSILESHAINPAAIAALSAGDEATFLVERERTLRARTDSFIESRAQWLEP